MGKLLLEVETKRPDWATPERLLLLRESGVSVKELAQQCGVIPPMIYRLLARAREARIKELEAQVDLDPDVLKSDASQVLAGAAPLDHNIVSDDDGTP